MTLSDWMDANERTAAWLARKLGVSHPTARRLMSGKGMPRRETMTKIGELTNGQVGPADFYAEDPASEAA